MRLGIAGDGIFKNLLGAAYVIAALPLGHLIGVAAWLMITTGVLVLTCGMAETWYAGIRPARTYLRFLTLYDAGWMLATLAALGVARSAGTGGGEVWMAYQAVAAIVLAVLLMTGAGAGPVGDRDGTVLLSLASATVVLIAAQFALAGFSTFTIDKTPADNTFAAVGTGGYAVAAMTLAVLVAVLASRPARTHRRTLWLAVTLTVLSVAVMPTTGAAGTTTPLLGALHVLIAVIIFAAAGWLTIEVARRRPPAGQPDGTAPSATRAACVRGAE
ncbi:MAG: hypothetical protein J2P25_21465 [Nocardiopsaceae bacterium]|nr:hypothetical protein [Nocardiopsaceae bacterium]